MATLTIAPNPFTPRSGQEPKVFLGRERELATFQKHLDRAKKGTRDHFVVLGGWGTGKTTLLKECKKAAQMQKTLTSFVGVHEFNEGDLIAPIIQLLTRIPRNLPIKFGRLKRFGTYLQGVGISLPVIGGGIEIKERKRFDGDPQELLLEGLVRLWQELKEESAAVVVFLDDVQNYEAVRKVLGVMKNVLSDEEIAKKTGYLFVLSATDEGWAGFLRKNDPIGRYFVPMLTVTSLSENGCRQMVEETLKGTGVSFAPDVTASVFEYTGGHPYQLQILCSYLYENQIRGQVGREQLDAALSQTLDELGPIVLDHLYFAASEQERVMLQAMSAKFVVYSFDEILRMVVRHRISKGTLAAGLLRLVQKGLVKKESRGKYRVVNRLFNEFVSRQ